MTLPIPIVRGMLVANAERIVLVPGSVCWLAGQSEKQVIIIGVVAQRCRGFYVHFGHNMRAAHVSDFFCCSGKIKPGPPLEVAPVLKSQALNGDVAEGKAVDWLMLP